jgi:hypothetical protein
LILILFHVSQMQDSQDPLANSLLQPQFPGTLVLELDWLPLRTQKNDPMVLCIAGADGSFCLVEVNMYVPELFLSFWILFYVLTVFICLRMSRLYF